MRHPSHKKPFLCASRNPLLKVFTFIFLSLSVWSCTSEDPQQLEERVSEKLARHDFEAAFSELQSKDSSNPEIQDLLIEAHFSYAHYLTYQADHVAMSERMGDALRHYRRVIELDEQHSEASYHIDLIENIYHQMDRPVPDGIAQ